MNLLRIFTIALFLITIQSCDQYNRNKNSNKLTEIINSYQDHDGYDYKKYPLGLVTKEHYKNESDFANELLLNLASIDTSFLNENDKISYKLLSFKLQDIIDYYEFERYLNPLLSDSGFHSSLGYMVKPLYNYKQVKEYINKLNALPDYVDQHFINLREGLSKGVSQPLVIFKGYESTYNDHITKDFKANYFYSPFLNMPDDLSESQIDSVLYEGQKAIEQSVIPEFKRIKEFFEKEYFPNTRTKIGVSEIQDGLDYYQNRINYYTTSKSYTADIIHKIGIKEVSRIKKEMVKIISDLNFNGSFDDFFNFLRTDERFYAKTPRELLMFARDISKRIDAKLPKFFKTLPRKPYGVAPVPDAIAPKYTGGRYVGTSKNSTEPGYYWVNTYDLKSRTLYTIPALTAHEGVPGHHLQGSLNNELGDSIPRFRRNLYLSAFGEGWGLYSEFLANDMGIYRNEYEQFGKLTYEMWRACRLVVDTGIHAMGWTREQAVEYMSKNTALSLHEINTEVDRYISWPGQALSYKIGEIKIRELREKAKISLGKKFDIRDFHEVILSQGTVTLSILEQRINNYINKTKNE
ncbi:MAG: DUF885 domain-containing protein [Bacteroidota bacterium]|nr:DUF885 domain-containing protein [Bacteroidota bacterium]|tara:strand:+ start:718 stop:2451 length:1734 start_codon:yes stop_codon:yes gene_type:complete